MSTTSPPTVAEAQPAVSVPSGHGPLGAQQHQSFVIRVRPRRALLEAIAHGPIAAISPSHSGAAAPSPADATGSGGNVAAGAKRPRSHPPPSSSSPAVGTTVEGQTEEDRTLAKDAAGSAPSHRELLKAAETSQPWLVATNFLQSVLDAYVPTNLDLTASYSTESVGTTSLSATLASCEQVCNNVRALTDSGYAPALYTQLHRMLTEHASAVVTRLIDKAEGVASPKGDEGAIASLAEVVDRLCAESTRELCDIVERSGGKTPTSVTTESSVSSKKLTGTALEQFIASEVKRMTLTKESTAPQQQGGTSSTAAVAETADVLSAASAAIDVAEKLALSSPEIATLRMAVRLWDRWASVMTIISDVFMFLGRRYILLETPEGSITQLGVKVLADALRTSKTTRGVVGVTSSGESVFEKANAAFAVILSADHTMAKSVLLDGFGGNDNSTRYKFETKSAALQIGAWCISNDQKRVLSTRSRSGVRLGAGVSGALGGGHVAPHFAVLRALMSEMLSYRDLVSSVNLYTSSLHPKVVSTLSVMYSNYSTWLASEATPSQALLSISSFPSRTFNQTATSPSNPPSRRLSPTTTSVPKSVQTATMTIMEMLDGISVAAPENRRALEGADSAITPKTVASSATPAPTQTAAAASNTAVVPLSSGLTPAVVAEAIIARCVAASDQNDLSETLTISASLFFHCAYHLVYRERRRAVVFLNNSNSSVAGSSEMIEELVQQHAIKPYVGLIFQRGFRDSAVEGVALETQNQPAPIVIGGWYHAEGSSLGIASARVPTGLNAIALGFHLLCMRYVRQKDVAKETFHQFIESVSGWYIVAASLFGDEAGGAGSGLPSSANPESYAAKLRIMKEFARTLADSLGKSDAGCFGETLVERIDRIEATFLSKKTSQLASDKNSAAAVLESVSTKKIAYLKAYARLVRSNTLEGMAKDALERLFPGCTTTVGGAPAATSLANASAIALRADAMIAIALRRRRSVFAHVAEPLTSSNSATAAESSEDDSKGSTDSLFVSWLKRAGITSASSPIDFSALVQGERGYGAGGGLHPSPLLELPTLTPEHLISNLVAVRNVCDTIVRRCFLGEGAPSVSNPVGAKAQDATTSDTPVLSLSTEDDDVPRVVTSSPLIKSIVQYSTGVFSDTAMLAASRVTGKNRSGGAAGGGVSHGQQQQVTTGFYAAEFTRAIRVGFERGFNKYAPCVESDSDDEEAAASRPPSRTAAGTTLEAAFDLVDGATIPKGTSANKKVTLSSDPDAANLAKWSTRLERFHSYLQLQRPLDLGGEVVPELLAQHLDTLLRTLGTPISSHMAALAACSCDAKDSKALSLGVSSPDANDAAVLSLMDATGLETRSRFEVSNLKHSQQINSSTSFAKRDIERALTLFDYLPTKDVFEALYVRDFSKRVLGFVQECVLNMSERAAAGVAFSATPGQHPTTDAEEPEGDNGDDDDDGERSKKRLAGEASSNDNRTSIDVSNFVALERHAIRHLRQVCGTALTSKLEGMLKDLTDGVGKINEAYHAWLSSQKADKISSSLSVPPAATLGNNGTISSAALTAAGVFFVLSQSFWPFADTFKPNAAALPTAMSKELETFSTFFSSHRKSCALRWVPTLSECVLGFKPSNESAKSQSVDLHMSLLQGLILTTCFNADLSDASNTNIKAPTNRLVTVDEVVRAVCEMESAEAGVALPVASSVGITVSSSGATLAKVESRRALARSKSLTREQQAVLAHVQCALISLAAPEVGVLTPVFAQGRVGAASPVLYPLFGGLLEGFRYNPAAPILKPHSAASPHGALRYVPQLLVSNLGTSAYASNASSQPLAGSHASVRQHVLARATTNAMTQQQSTATTVNDGDNVSVEQLCDLKWTACLKYLNAEILYRTAHPVSGSAMLRHPKQQQRSATSSSSGVADAALPKATESPLHAQITMRLLSAVSDWMDSAENGSPSSGDTPSLTLANEVRSFVPIYLSPTDLEMASTIFEVDNNQQQVRCMLRPGTFSAKAPNASVPLPIMVVPSFDVAYPHLVKHVTTPSVGIMGGANASPYRDSTARVAKSVAMQRPYIIDVAVVQVLKSVGKANFSDLLASLAKSAAIAGKFEVSNSHLRARLVQLKARGVVNLVGDEAGAADENILVEYKA